ncbi:hypothetical protein F5X68DRAFT_199758 [Plectosphaerella plurivora]|uniref:SET domain-containing protein n=1 Tax=Plectosphaerella plurivora TaxID=936078 RepID=A0A9P9ABV7_9PEZI|nr:hypothetical protein F5X68DRAFT_199758 [Plectosphaerella plurivora]
MKTTTIIGLPLLATVSLALKESISNRQDEVCLSSLLLAARPPLCSLSHEHPVIKQTPPIEKVLLDTVSPWTQSTTCYQNGTVGLEFCVYLSTPFANGRGMAVITDKSRAAHIARAVAGFMPEDTKARRATEELAPLIHKVTQKPVNVVNPKYKVVPMEGKGFGVIATGPIKMGELILQETVSMLIDYAAFTHVPKDKLRKLQRVAIDGLPKAHRKRFLEMSPGAAGWDSNVEELVERVLVTNSFDVEMEDKVRDDEFYAAFVETARMNHDCRPNIDYRFDPKTLTQRTAAIRDIAEGEELTLSYINTIQTHEARRDRLKKTWHFDCTCPSCMQPAPQIAASDQRIRQIKDLRGELADYQASSRATPGMAELLVSLYEQEKAWGTLPEGYTLAAIEWNGVGEAWTATKYARLAIEHGLATGWSDSGDNMQMRKLAADPWNHWSWMLRTRKRMGWGDRVEDNDEDEDEED